MDVAPLRLTPLPFIRTIVSCLSRVLSASLLLGFSSLLVPEIATSATVLTSVRGNVFVDGERLEQYSVLDVNDRIDSFGRATASLLLGDATIAKLGHGASLGFGNDLGNGPRALDLHRGHLKLSMSQRTTGTPFEIRTPAAIARSLAMEVHVAVNPETGDTVVTSLAHEVRVIGVPGQDASGDNGIVISKGQQVTVRTGSRPGPIKTVDLTTFARSSVCLDDSRYRISAIHDARAAYSQNSLDGISRMDIEDNLPMVSAAPPLIPTGTLGPEVRIQSCQSFQQCAGPAPGPNPVFVPSGLPIGPTAP